MVWQRWPTAGSFGYAETAADYDRLVDDLIRRADHLRPQDGLLRRAAVGPRADARAAGVRRVPAGRRRDPDRRRCSARWSTEAIAADERGDALRGAPGAAAPRGHVARGAQRAGRPAARPPGPARRPRPAAEVVRALVERLRPQLEDAGDWDTVAELAGRAAGPRRLEQPAARPVRRAGQGRRRRRAGRGRDRRARSRFPLEHRRRSRRLPRGARGRGAGAVRGAVPGLPPGLRACSTSWRPTSWPARRERCATRRWPTGSPSASTASSRPSRSTSCRASCRPHEWAVLAAGLTQRARAIELFLRDIYGAGPASSTDGVLDWETVHGTAAAGNRRRRSCPQDVVRAPVIGFDLVRDALGGWRVLEDNTRVPVRRRLRDRHAPADARRRCPSSPATSPMRDPRTALRADRRHPARGAPWRPDPVVALLSDGADNSAWYEHRMIAARGRAAAGRSPARSRSAAAGCVAAGGGSTCCTCASASSWPTCTPRRATRSAPASSRPRATATVVLANAPGAGVADDKAMYCHGARPDQLLPGRAAAAGARPDLPVRRLRTSAGRCSTGSTSSSPSRSTGTAAAGC